MPVALGQKLSREHIAKIVAARRRPLSDRFAKFVDPRAEHECWPWKGGHNGAGYGMLRVDKVHRLATHVSRELDGRPRPSDGLFALHACDNPTCVNPHHLRWGTRSDNARDAIERGQTFTGCKKGHGEEHQFSEGAARKRRCRVCQQDRNARRCLTRAAKRGAA
jgi:hypothetical protein